MLITKHLNHHHACAYRAWLWRIGLTMLLSLPMFAYAEHGTLIAVVTSADEAKAINIQSNELNPIYWRKKLYDKEGKAIRPANLHAEHPLRLLFSQQVLKSTPKAQVDYWNGLYFHGTLPPRTLQSEEAVMRYVADTSNAIGYVDACHVDERVHTLLWLDNNGIYSELPHRLECKN